MASGVRRLAALCMLVVFSIFIAEGVWASQCVETGGPSARQTAHGQQGHDASGAGHTATCPPSDESEQPGSLPCPLAPAGGSGCLTMSMPGSMVELSDPISGAAGVRPPSDLLPDLAIVTGIDRPPRA